MYRQILAERSDNSVTIVSVGYLTNLQGLLASEADEHRDLGWPELVAAKVDKLVTMGGHCPDSAAHPDGREYNFEMDAEATNEWDPTTDNQQYFLLNALPKAQIEDLLDELLIQPPRGK